MRRLVALSYSPWSEKARWALDHHRLAYREIEFVPILGTPWLRVAAKRPFGRVSIPTLLDDDGAYVDSFVIAKHVDGIGQGSRLFPEDAAETIAAYNERSEAMLSACRAICTPRISADADAAFDATPPVVPGRRLMARTAVKLAELLINSKYKVNKNLDENVATLRDGLSRLRADLGKRETLLPTFSFADIAMAVTMQWVQPLPTTIRPVGDALNRVLSQPELAAEFADLVAWRDRIYAKYRQAPQA